MHVETERVNGIAWKLERSQFFTEAPDDPAWQAFASGDWDKSLAVFETERAARRAEAAKYERQGSELRRLRIVEHPVSAYLQWEMHALRVNDESRMPVRVLPAGMVSERETSRPLPELVILGDHVMYEVRYDERWRACGARRIDDRDVIREAASELASLWILAESVGTYFAREIAPLPPPAH